MKHLRMLPVLLLCALLAGGLSAQTAPTQAQAAYDCAASEGLPQAECEALVAIYNATGGDHWIVQTGWLQTATPCTWYGVTCEDGRVTRLEMINNAVSGALPPEIGELTALNLLKLNNKFPYEERYLTALPAEIGNLAALTVLDMGYNDLTALPVEIGNLAALTVLDLSYNRLAALPPEIGDLTTLQELSLDNNDLNTLPPEIGKLSALTKLSASYNGLSTLPPEIGDLAALTVLQLSRNEFAALPPGIGNLHALTSLSLSGNYLTSLSPEIGNLHALLSLFLSHNELAALPPEIGNLAALTSLYLGNNHLTALPSEIGNLTALGELDLWNNHLAALPPEMGHLTALTRLYLSGNHLATLPPEIGNLTALRLLYLSGNRLTTLPPEIGNFAGLWELYLDNNALTALPPEIGNLAKLSVLALSNNNLATLPPEMDGLSILTRLYLSNNDLITLPTAIGDLTGVWEMTLDHNALITLPPEIGNIADLKMLYLHNNPLNGEIPAFMTALKLYTLTFYETNWCAPPTGAVPAWLLTISKVHGTGMVCGQAPGSLQGVVTLPGGIPANGIQVDLYRDVVNNIGYHLTATHTHTLTDGVYRFDGLGQEIDYRVRFTDPAGHYAPEYYDNGSNLGQATAVTVTLGTTRTGIDAELSPSVVELVKSANPTRYVANGGLITYTLVLSANVDATLHLYDPLGPHLTWQGFAGKIPSTLTYTNAALTGTVDADAKGPLPLSFVVRVNVPEESFVSDFAQVGNTAYYYFTDETLALKRPANTQVNSVYRGTLPTLYLPLVMRSL